MEAVKKWLPAGEKQYKLDELMPIYQDVMAAKDVGTFADFMEAFKTFDREGQGYVSSAEVRQVLSAMGDKLTDGEIDEILQSTDTQEDLDGNIKFEDFIKKVLDGPEGK